MEEVGFDHFSAKEAILAGKGDIDSAVNILATEESKEKVEKPIVTVFSAPESVASAPGPRRSSRSRHDQSYDKSWDGNARPTNKIIKLGGSSRGAQSSSS